MFGGDPFENDAITQQICFCAENQVYPDYFRVRDVFTAARLLYPTWDAAYAEELVELFELPKKRRVVKLSRGMRSAVGIVTGLASRAPLTMFDEPYLGLDATARQLFYNQLLADYAENPRTILLSTHLIDEVSELIEHVLVVDRGQLVIDEEAERLRGRAITISGPADTVDKFTYAMTRLHEERLLGQSRVTVLGDADDPQHARALGLDVKPVSLQELVVQSTSGEYRRRTMNRVLSAARLHLVSGQAITVPGRSWAVPGHQSGDLRDDPGQGRGAGQSVQRRSGLALRRGADGVRPGDEQAAAVRPRAQPDSPDVSPGQRGLRHRPVVRVRAGAVRAVRH